MLAPHIATKLRQSEYRLAVTGAGGWLGMATLDLVSSALGEAFADRVCCFGSGARTLTLLDGTQVDQRPLHDLGLLAPRPTLVLHFAFLTKDRAEAMPEEQYRAANRAIGRTVLDSLDGIGAEAIFVASSGAAAFADDPNSSPAMRLYGSLKKDDERMFAGWAESAGRRAAIARIFNLSGPYMNKHASYALASFLLDALAARPVAVRAARPVIRSYVAIRELMSLVLALLLDENWSVVRFDTGGAPMEMQEIAEAVAAICGPVAVVRPAMIENRADEYVGDDPAYRRLLADYDIEPVAFGQQVIETASYFARTAVSGWPFANQHVSADAAPSLDPRMCATLTKSQSKAVRGGAANLNE